MIAVLALVFMLIGLFDINDNFPSKESTLETSAMSNKKFGKCHKFERPRTFLDFNNKANSYFKFSIEEKIDKGLSKSFINDDYLLDTYNQLYVANQIFTNVLKLSFPLNTDRYKKAKFINITLEESDKVYGIAYDEVVANKHSDISDCFVGMKISSKVDPKHNVTPSHELFHIYQNSVMMFKQSWLTEGLARWSESLFKSGMSDETPLPQNREQLLEVFDSSYAASKFWTRLFKLVDEESEFKIPSHLNTITYTDGSPIIKDNKAYGVKFIPILFDELSVESKNVSDEKVWEQYAWKEKDQKSSDLNPYIWVAIKRAVSKTVPYGEQSQELKDCMSIEL